MSLQADRSLPFRGGALGTRCAAALAACGCAEPVSASGAMEGAGEGIVLALLLLPPTIYFAAVAVLLLFRVFRRRGWVIAHAIGSVLATVLACVALVSFAPPPNSGGTALLMGTAVLVLGFGVIAPWLQYRAVLAESRALSALVLVLAALELGLPLAAWLAHEVYTVQFRQTTKQAERRGREAGAGDLAAAVSGRTADVVFMDYLEWSPLLRGAAPLRDDDRAAAERLIADRDTYSGALHAKLVWDRHADHGVDALLADPDTPALRFILLEMLESHAATRYCGEAAANRALRDGVRAWFWEATRTAPSFVSTRSRPMRTADTASYLRARIEALCTAVDGR